MAWLRGRFAPYRTHHHLQLKGSVMPDTVMTTEPQAGPAPRYQRRSGEFDKLAAALAKAQGAMENAEKGAENPAFKRDGKASTYATLGNVWEAIRKPLTDNGLSILQWPHTVENGVEIETELLHESGQFMRDVLWLPCPQMTVHAVGSAITYGRRYALMSIVGIAPEDDDGNAANEGHKPGAAGSAGGGQDFRPAGPRRFTPPVETHRNGVRQASANGARMAADEPESVARAAGRMKGELQPRPAANAVEQMAWIKDARKLIDAATTKGELSDWWRQNEDQRETAAAAVPVEYDKLIVAFDDKMTAVAQAGA